MPARKYSTLAVRTLSLPSQGTLGAPYHSYSKQWRRPAPTTARYCGPSTCLNSRATSKASSTPCSARRSGRPLPNCPTASFSWLDGRGDSMTSASTDIRSIKTSGASTSTPQAVGCHVPCAVLVVERGSPRSGTAAGGFKALWPVPMVRVRSRGRWTITPLSTSIDRPRTLHWLSIRWVDRFRWPRSIAQSASNTSQCERLTDCLRLDDPFCRTRTLTFERLCGQKPRARGPRPPPHRRFVPRAHRSWNLRRNQRGSIPERGVWRWL